MLQGLSATPIIPQRNFDNGGYISSELTNTLDIDRSIPVAWAASPLNFAIGAEQRHDTYRLLAGEPSSYYGSGSESFDGYTPLDAAGHSRTNYAFYVDFAIDPIAHLHTDLAIRYENYSDFGGATVGKFTARYDVNRWMAVRGTVSTGFRAPTLAEEFFSGTDVAPTGADVRLPSNSDAAKVAGFSPLKPEQSDNYSLGIVLHPLPRLQITADAYSILIKDRILDSGFLLGSVGGYGTVAQGVLNAIAARGITLAPGLSYSGITVFRNAANTRTNGVEVTATYSSDFEEYGHVDWSLGFNYNKTEATKLYPLPADVVNDDFGQTAIPGNLSSLLTETPREKAILQAYWTLGKWGVNLRETIYGETASLTSFDQTGVGPGTYKETIPVTGITDISIDYKLTPLIKLTAGANNLFDVYPPKTPTGTNMGAAEPVDGDLAYSVPYNFSPFGINGGYYYGRVTVSF